MVRKVLEVEEWGRQRNAFLSTMGALYAWGRFEEKTTLNPVADIEQRQMGEHEPWPEHVLEAGLKAEDDTVRPLPFTCSILPASASAMCAP
jgi:hypothetical protein